MFLLVALAATIVTQPPSYVGLRTLYEAYDYDYYDDDRYGEFFINIQAVEIRHELPGGAVGWEYVGMIHSVHLTWYDGSDEESTRIFWGSRSGGSGGALTEDEAVREIMESAGLGNEFEIIR